MKEAILKQARKVLEFIKKKIKKWNAKLFLVINKTIIMVNLDAPPKLPLAGAKIEFQSGSGWVTVEKRADGLYVDGRKIILYLSERQKNKNTIKGYELQKELSGKIVLHPNIMDALFENPHLIPRDWEMNKEGDPNLIFFWSVVFRAATGNLYVRRIYLYDGQWTRDGNWIDDVWRYHDPAALLES